MQHAVQRQIEAFMVARQAGDRGRGDGHAMITLDAANDLLLVLLAQRVRAIPDHLGNEIVGLGAGGSEMHLGHRHRRKLDQQLGEIDGRAVCLVGKGVVIGQLLHLLRRRFHQPLFTETERHRPEPRHRLDIALAAAVGHIDAFAALDHQTAGLFEFAQIDVRMHLIGDIACLDGIRQDGHR
ncbi:hypothetical protein D3C80_943770 [compost metagenome]